MTEYQDFLDEMVDFNSSQPLTNTQAINDFVTHLGAGLNMYANNSAFWDEYMVGAKMDTQDDRHEGKVVSCTSSLPRNACFMVSEGLENNKFIEFPAVAYQAYAQHNNYELLKSSGKRLRNYKDFMISVIQTIVKDDPRFEAKVNGGDEAAATQAAIAQRADKKAVYKVKKAKWTEHNNKIMNKHNLRKSEAIADLDAAIASGDDTRLQAAITGASGLKLPERLKQYQKAFDSSDDDDNLGPQSHCEFQGGIRLIRHIDKEASVANEGEAPSLGWATRHGKVIELDVDKIIKNKYNKGKERITKDGNEYILKINKVKDYFDDTTGITEKWSKMTNDIDIIDLRNFNGSCWTVTGGDNVRKQFNGGAYYTEHTEPQIPDKVHSLVIKISSGTTTGSIILISNQDEIEDETLQPLVSKLIPIDHGECVLSNTVFQEKFTFGEDWSRKVGGIINLSNGGATINVVMQESEVVTGDDGGDYINVLGDLQGDFELESSNGKKNEVSLKYFQENDLITWKSKFGFLETGSNITGLISFTIDLLSLCTNEMLLCDFCKVDGLEQSDYYSRMESFCKDSTKLYNKNTLAPAAVGVAEDADNLPYVQHPDCIDAVKSENNMFNRTAYDSYLKDTYCTDFDNKPWRIDVCGCEYAFWTEDDKLIDQAYQDEASQNLDTQCTTNCQPNVVNYKNEQIDGLVCSQNICIQDMGIETAGVNQVSNENLEQNCTIDGGVKEQQTEEDATITETDSTEVDTYGISGLDEIPFSDVADVAGDVADVAGDVADTAGGVAGDVADTAGGVADTAEKSFAWVSENQNMLIIACIVCIVLFSLYISLRQR